MSYKASVDQAKATERTAKYNAKVQENAAIQEDMEMREQISRTRRENKRLLASQRAGVAASGIEMTGSPLEVLGANAANLELRAQDMARQSTLGVMRGQTQKPLVLAAGAADLLAHLHVLLDRLVLLDLGIVRGHLLGGLGLLL